MAIFTTNESKDLALDWVILSDGGVALYWRPEILRDDLSWLESKGYRTVSFDASDWRSEDRMHDSLKAHLSFPEYYGNNLNALDECALDDLVISDTGGLALALNHYDRFVAALPRRGEQEKSTAEVVLDIFARAVRFHMLLGRRLLILVQSDDPGIQFDRLGGISAQWNRREWLNKDRGL